MFSTPDIEDSTRRSVSPPDTLALSSDASEAAMSPHDGQPNGGDLSSMATTPVAGSQTVVNISDEYQVNIHTVFLLHYFEIDSFHKAYRFIGSNTNWLSLSNHASVRQKFELSSTFQIILEKVL